MVNQNVKILLVEDDSDDVWIIRNLLNDRWDGRFDLIHVDTLGAAIEVCAAHHFDLILLDLSLPDSSGLETFVVLKSQSAGIPIVVLTGYDNENTAVTAVQAGAQDYLVKGKVDDNLLVRSIRYAIERVKRRRAEEELLKTSEEFRLAQRIQKRLFPENSPSIAGLDIAGVLRPARETAGDHFDYLTLQDGCLGLVVGDVSGHGMGPALVMAEIHASIRALAQSFTDVGEILTRANRILSGESDELRFITLMLAKIDAESRSLEYASAGLRGYVIGEDGMTTVLDSTSQPLGIDTDGVVPVGTPFKLHDNDTLALFTDGVEEAESSDRERFGVKRALDVIRRQRGRSARDIIDCMFNAIDEFVGKGRQTDDITIVLVKVGKENP